MPVEIRELVIRTTVTGGAEDVGTPGRPSPRGGIDREKLVADCVEQVMEILREERER